MDVHFKNRNFRSKYSGCISAFRNLVPISLVQISVALLPYEQYLSRFAAYFQQGDNWNRMVNMLVEMGKKWIMKRDQLFGENQEQMDACFYQLIHQGTKLIPADFIAGANSLNVLGDHIMQNYYQTFLLKQKL